MPGRSSSSASAGGYLTSDARAFLARYEVPYVSVRDGSTNGVSADYGLTGLPETYYLDAQGRAVAHSARPGRPRVARAGRRVLRAAESGRSHGDLVRDGAEVVGLVLREHRVGVRRPRRDRRVRELVTRRTRA